MAVDSNIGSLPAAASIEDDSLLVAEQQGEAKHFTGKLLKDYAKQGVDALVAAAREATEKAEQAAKDAQAAADAVEDVTADAEAAKAAAQAAENARAAAVQAAQYAEQVAALAAQNAASGVENRLAGYVSDAQNAKTGAETAKNAAEQAAETAAAEAVRQAETQLQGYVSEAEQAKQDAQNAAGTAAQDAVTAVGSEMAGYVSAAQAAQKAAEQARDEAQGIAGGDFASTVYVDNKASEAESNANKYTDKKIAEISIPGGGGDASDQIEDHNTDTTAHADIRAAIPTAVSQLTNDSGYLTKETDPTVPAWAKAASKPGYTASEVGADASGSAAKALTDAKAYTDQKLSTIPTPDVSGQIGTHNTDGAAHTDIRALIAGLTNRLNALADSDDTTLDQMSELVAYIKSNKSLIDAITTAKVSVSDIVNDLVTNNASKPLSAAQGVALKALVDAAVAAASTAKTTADGKADASHNQAASTITAGTFAGQVVANSSGQAPGTKLIRNSKLMAASDFDAVTNWSSHITNGEIVWRYE